MLIMCWEVNLGDEEMVKLKLFFGGCWVCSSCVMTIVAFKVGQGCMEVCLSEHVENHFSSVIFPWVSK